MGQPVFIIIGHPQNGKTEVGKALEQLTGLPRGSTSDTIYESLAQNSGVPVDVLRSIPKEELRPQLIAEGDRLAAADITSLAWPLIAKGVRIIDGVRRKAELTAIKMRCGMNDFKPVIWWIQRVPIVSRIKDNTEVISTDAQAVFINDGKTVEELKHKVERWLRREKLL